MNEFELKFQVPLHRAAAVEAALRRGRTTEKRLYARYFDTEDEALARHRLVLRLRQEGDAWVQTAKGPGTGYERMEHNVRAAAGEHAPDVERHAAHPVATALRGALADAAAPQLQPVFEVDVVRLARTVESAGTEVEIAFDRGEIRAAGRSHAVLELEFELKAGSAGAVVELASQWCREHNLWLDPLTKSGAGWRLAKGIAQSPAAHAGEVRPAGAKSELLAAVLASGLQQVLANAREIALGRHDDEHVHQLRVGLRRLRTALRELGMLGDLDALAREVLPPLQDVFHPAGEHRDRSTLVPALEQAAHEAGGPPLAWRPPLPDLGAAVRDWPFQDALLRVLACMQALATQPEDGGRRKARKAVAARLDRLHRRVLHASGDFPSLSPDGRHALRKRLKRLRYLAELTQPLFEAREVDQYVAHLKGLQDALGTYQDAVAGQALFTAHAMEEPDAWFAAGWLAGREPLLVAACERARRKAARKAQPFWN